MAPQRIAQQVDLFEAEVVNELLDVLGEGLRAGGGQRQVVQREHRNDDPGLACEMGEEVLEVAQRSEEAVQQHQGCALLRTLDVAEIARCDQILFHG